MLANVKLEVRKMIKYFFWVLDESTKKITYIHSYTQRRAATVGFEPIKYFSSDF